jgi:ferredoxin
MSNHDNFKQLLPEFAAIAVAAGHTTREQADAWGLQSNSRGITVDRLTHATSLPGVFAGGNAIGVSQMAVRSVGQGKDMAAAVDRYLTNQPLHPPFHFTSRIGRLHKEEVQELVNALPSTSEHVKYEDCYLPEQARAESSRCLYCDCRKLEECKLRIYSEEYHADQSRFKGERKQLHLYSQHESVLYEPGKCIKCGLCVRICERAKEPLGMTFIGRGFDIRIEVPFNEALKEGLQKVAAECVQACPTAALAFKK